MKLSIVLSTQQTRFQAASFSGALETNLERISGLGYQGVELAIRDPQLVNLPQLETLIRQNGLEVPAIGTGQAWNEEGLSFTDPDETIRRAAIERIKSHIPVAARLNALIIVGLIRGVIKPGVQQEQGEEWLTQALRECSRAAASQGVRLALEPINRYETTLVNTVQQGLTLIEAVGEVNFGLLLDTFHMNIEEPCIERSIAACGKRVFHFHVADSNRWYPGYGHLDFEKVLLALKDTGYAGYVSGEFMPKPDAETAARESITFLTPILRRLSD